MLAGFWLALSALTGACAVLITLWAGKPLLAAVVAALAVAVPGGMLRGVVCVRLPPALEQTSTGDAVGPCQSGHVSQADCLAPDGA